MTRLHRVLGLVLMLSIVAVVRAQMLNGDASFPVLNALRWNMNMGEIRNLCEGQHVMAGSTDSTITIDVPFFGFSARTEIQIDPNLKTPRQVQVKFKDPTKSLEDTLVSHFTALCKREPIQTVKEKSFLIMTIRMEMALWKSATEIIDVVTAKQGGNLIDLNLTLFPPTKKANQTGAKQ